MIKPLILDISSRNILSLKNFILKFSKEISISSEDNKIINSTYIFHYFEHSFFLIKEYLHNKSNEFRSIKSENNILKNYE